jgi:hypothetical protein
LRSFGIRTATDLLQAYNQAICRGRDADGRAIEVAALRDELELRSPPHSKVRSIQTIIDTPDKEWFVQVRNWRCTEFGAVNAWYWYLDGHDWTTTQCSSQPRRVTFALRQFDSVPMATASKDNVDPGNGQRVVGPTRGPATVRPSRARVSRRCAAIDY